MGAKIKDAKNIMLFNALGENNSVTSQSTICVDIPSLVKTAFLTCLITPDLPKGESGLVGIKALETLRLLPRNWPGNLNFRC
jgi:hypothetical protein